jgi:hypothetical protein
MVAAQTGLTQPEAERRVYEVAARVKGNIALARRSIVVIAFAAGAAALLGAAASWLAGGAGGRSATVITRCGIGATPFRRT